MVKLPQGVFSERKKIQEKKRKREKNNTLGSWTLNGCWNKLGGGMEVGSTPRE